MGNAALDGLSLRNSRADGQETDTPSAIVSAPMVLKAVHSQAVQIAAVIGHDHQHGFLPIGREFFNMPPQSEHLFVGIPDGFEIK
jgi:hypothetical protein